MADLGRKDFSDKAEETLKPDSQKSLFDKTKESVTDAGDKVAGNVQPGDNKSITQKLSDSTSTKPGEESYLDTAKKTLGDAVQYVEQTAEGGILPYSISVVSR
ncbi:MAG: hypothetical protein Q9175_005581 [Cornicularia normoerica]